MTKAGYKTVYSMKGQRTQKMVPQCDFSFCHNQLHFPSVLNQLPVASYRPLGTSEALSPHTGRETQCETYFLRGGTSIWRPDQIVPRQGSQNDSFQEELGSKRSGNPRGKSVGCLRKALVICLFLQLQPSGGKPLCLPHLV